MSLRLVPPIDHFRRLWDLGYRNLVPIIPPGAPLSEKSSLWRRLQAGHDSRGKVPGVLGADGLWRGFDWMRHETSEADLGLWAAWGAGVGIKTGGADGVVMIDVDTRQKDLALTVKQRIETHIGRTPLRIGESPKAGYVVRCSEPLAYSRIELGKHPITGKPERIELLNGGRQFVAEGQHPCGVAYRWPESNPLVELDRLVLVTPEQLTDLLTDLSRTLPGASGVVTERMRLANGPVSQEALRGDPRLVQRALACMPNTPETFPTYDDFIAIGFAIKAALPDDGELALELFQQWAARWPEGNDPTFVEDKFHSMHAPFRSAGAPGLYKLAEELSGGTFQRAEQWFEPGVGEELSPQSQKEKKRLKQALFGDEARSALTESAAPLIKGLLDQGVMTILYGESGTGKTFVALDMAYHIATGRDWGGMRVTQSGVVYVAAEGGRGIKRRALALARKFGSVDVPITIISSPIDLLRPEADTGPLIEAILEAEALFPQPFKVRLVVIDTFSRALAGGEENGSADMGAIVINFDRIRHATGVHLLVVHHSGKDRAKGARGHSLLRAATDTEIEVADYQIEVTKQRDMESGFAIGFKLDPIVLGEDADKDIQISATIRLVGRDAVASGAVAGRERAVLEALTAIEAPLSAAARAEGVPIELVAAVVGDRRQAIRSYLVRLAARRLVAVVGRGRWRLMGASPAFAEFMG